MSVKLIQPHARNGLVDQILFHDPLAFEHAGAGLEYEGRQVTLLDAGPGPDIEGAFINLSPDICWLTGFTALVKVIRNTASLYTGTQVSRSRSIWRSAAMKYRRVS